VCGDTCCLRDEICHPGVDGDPSICCEQGRVPCGTGTDRFCCQPGESCVGNDPNHDPYCCAEDTEGCDGRCCGEDEFCCNSKTCCPKGLVCITEPGFPPYCCEEGKIPCGGRCCGPDPGGKCCQTPGPNSFFYCCPENRRCCSTGGPQCCV
jgi:hypothetical protein